MMLTAKAKEVSTLRLPLVECERKMGWRLRFWDDLGYKYRKNAGQAVTMGVRSGNQVGRVGTMRQAHVARSLRYPGL
jgi:hypothetical protein